MGARRPWLRHEDRAILEAAEANRMLGQRPGNARLREVAEQIGRPYSSVRNRAARIKARSNRY